jgi:gluconokinase
MTEKTPLLLVVMGVSSSGKSTLARALGKALGLSMMDGDDLHSEQSVHKMQAGIALDDADRWPWLDRIANYLATSADPSSPEAGKVVACSALKRAYRDRIRQSLHTVYFIFLDGDSELIRSRMASRQGHFMQLELLDSQLRTLERPGLDEKDVIRVDTTLAVEALVAQVTAALHNALGTKVISHLQTH